MEDGYSYKNNNIYNFLEGDFFSWYADKKQWSYDFWKAILKIIKTIDEYTSFDFNVKYHPIDIFKELYMGIIPQSVRHSMGEYFTPGWLADCVITKSLNKIDNSNWKAIDPCCGSGIFLISLIKHIVGDKDIQKMSNLEKNIIKNSILTRVYGIDINPLSVLSARVGYYLALLPFGELRDIEIPVFLGDSAIIPQEEKIDNIQCYKYSVTNIKKPFDVILPKRFVLKPDFGMIMDRLQSCVKTDNSNILFSVIKEHLTDDELNSTTLLNKIKELCTNLTDLHKNEWDGIWIRISTNFMLIARLAEFDLIVGNPPWVKWEHLPTLYAEKIKELCNVKHIFSTDGQFGGTQLNVCALISNVTASNWLKKDGVLAFLMPDSIMSQNSYEGFRNFYTKSDKSERLYLQCIDKWEAPLRPFSCDGKKILQDFNTYYYSSKYIDYSKGIPVEIISRNQKISDDILNKYDNYYDVKKYLSLKKGVAIQFSKKTTAFSYISNKYDFSQIIGSTYYLYRTGVEFTPQQLYILEHKEKCKDTNYHYFKNKKFSMAKYVVNDTPSNGWKLPTKYIYPIATGPMLSPFKLNPKEEYCILPYDKNNTKNPITMETLAKEQLDLLTYLSNHKKLIDMQSEKSKAMRRGDEFYSLSKIGEYTFAKYIVAARDNSSFCAAVIKPRKTAWGKIKHTICVKHTIIISQDKNGRFISKDEAYYLSGILNSSIVIEYIHSSFKKNGFSLNKSNLHIPLFDSKNILHVQISKLAKNAEKRKNIQKIQDKLSELYVKICIEDKKIS